MDLELDAAAFVLSSHCSMLIRIAASSSASSSSPDSTTASGFLFALCLLNLLFCLLRSALRDCREFNSWRRCATDLDRPCSFP